MAFEQKSRTCLCIGEIGGNLDIGDTLDTLLNIDFTHFVRFSCVHSNTIYFSVTSGDVEEKLEFFSIKKN